MKSKLIIFIGVIVLLVVLSSNSFAKPVEDFSLELVDQENKEILKGDIAYFIDLVDDNLIPNASFGMSNQLNENYEFFTKFAISFVLDHMEEYEILDGEEYQYINQYGEVFSTNKYIDINTLYNIVNDVLGVEYYYIVEDYLKIREDIVPLLEIDTRRFSLEIERIVEFNSIDNGYSIVIKYKDMDILYEYILSKDEERLYISNMIVKE